MGPRLIRAFVRALLAIFYRRLDVVGLDHLPARGPLIVAANHQNGLIDPMLLMAALPRPLRPLAKSGLFRHPIIAPFLHLARALPVYRRQDAGSDTSGNALMFRAVGEALGHGGAILIFPEGVSQPEPALMPLRTLPFLWDMVRRGAFRLGRPTQAAPPSAVAHRMEAVFWGARATGPSRLWRYCFSSFTVVPPVAVLARSR